MNQQEWDKKLIEVAPKGFLDEVRECLSNKANPNAVNPEGKSVLMLTAMGGRRCYGTVIALIEAGGIVDKTMVATAVSGGNIGFLDALNGRVQITHEMREAGVAALRGMGDKVNRPHLRVLRQWSRKYLGARSMVPRRPQKLRFWVPGHRL